MDNSENWKLVDFDKYCPRCIHWEEDESDPYQKCNDCLAEEARLNSHKPINFKEKSL